MYHLLTRSLTRINKKSSEMYCNRYYKEWEILRAIRKQLAWRILVDLGEVNPRKGTAW